MTLETPDTGLVESFDIYRKRKPSVTLVVHREIVEPSLEFLNSVGSTISRWTTSVTEGLRFR